MKEIEYIELRMSGKLTEAENNGEKGTGEVGEASWLEKHRGGWVKVDEKWHQWTQEYKTQESQETENKTLSPKRET